MTKLTDEHVKELYKLAKKFLNERFILQGIDSSILFEDIVEDIVLASWTAINKNYDETKCSINTYIYQTVEFKVLDYKKTIAKKAKKAEEDIHYNNFWKPTSLNKTINSDNDDNEISLEDTVADNSESPIKQILRKELFIKLKELISDEVEFNLIMIWMNYSELSLVEMGKKAKFGNPNDKNYQQLVHAKIKQITNRLSKNKNFLEYLKNLI